MANPGDWWYTTGMTNVANTALTSNTITISPYPNMVQPLYVGQDASYMPAVSYPQLLGPEPQEGEALAFPEIARLRRRVKEVTQLVAA